MKHRTAVQRAGLLVAVSALALLLAACSTAPSIPSSSIKFRLPKTPNVKLAVSAPAGETLVAALHGNTPGSPSPGAPSTQVVPGSWYGYPSVLPIIDSVPNWVEVRLAQRPNESTAWVPQSDVTISSTPYKVVINLAQEHLLVYENNKQIFDFPAGIGTTTDPTVIGDFFITMKVPPPSPGYGPFVLVTSAHSDTITDWEDSGDAIIAIHGPITTYDDSLIGTTGAAISHGCVRLHDADLAQLANLPAGTPIDIVAT